MWRGRLVPARPGGPCGDPCRWCRRVLYASAARLSRINHIVVIYQENHSFDNPPIHSR